MPNDGQRGATLVPDDLTKLSPQQISKLRRDYPLLPEDYFDYMKSVGWGATESGRMVYEGPVPAAEIYGARSTLCAIVLPGDDYQGYCFGFNLKSGRYGEVSDAGQWEEWPLDLGVRYYVAETDGTQAM